jgi:serine/threonine protein kinase
MSRSNRRRTSPGRLDPSELGEILQGARQVGKAPRSVPHPDGPWQLNTVGGRRLIRELGRGATGRVFLAEQEGFARRVAIKILDPWLSLEQEFLTRFKREARAAAALRHENAVGVIDYGRDTSNGLYYIVFEYVAGGSLRERIERDGKVGEREALKIALGIAKALDSMDSIGILHRDIKPANILLTGEGTPKLADLGLARQHGLTRLTLPGFVMGTPSYLAPELITEDDVDIRLDLFALGLTLWEMLTGVLPMDSNTTGRLIPKHCARDIPDVRLHDPSISDAVAQVLKGLTARDRNDRYSSPSALILDLQRVLDGELPLGSHQTQELIRMQSGEWNQAFRFGESSADLSSSFEFEPLALALAPPAAAPTWEQKIVDKAWPEHETESRWSPKALLLAVTLVIAVVGGALFAATQSEFAPSRSGAALSTPETTGQSG